ncbi:MAG: DMT family protein [Bacteroidales bacterium]|nr:DMT family protein [Bacteroidales bacterium]
MQYFLPIAMLVVANIFMTFAWYGHLKLQQLGIIKDNTPLYVVILLSWLMALAEYSLQVPANRLGFEGNGGVFTLAQLKIIQEVITLVVFVVYSMISFGLEIHWNHIAAFFCLVMAVVFVFWK